jgi:membrane protease YdiL (CAAX protease family)
MLNSKSEINIRFESGRINRLAPFLIVLARPAFAIIAQGLMVLLFIVLKQPSPNYPVTAWWTVYATIIDIGCLLLLFFLVRKEGIRITDLISFNRQKMINDIFLGLGIFIIIFPLAMGLGSNVASILVYGSLKPELPPGSYIRLLPLWAVLYSRLIWWVIWSVTEELTYQGYALPRLQLITGRTWVAVIWIGFGWALQHSFLPLINFHHALWLFITFFPLTISLQLIYLKYRRLFPLIIAHWGMDFFSVIFLLKAA